MAKFFTSPADLAKWLKDNNQNATEAATRLLNIVQDGRYEQDIHESCRRIFAGTDEGASGILHGILARYDITDATVAEVDAKMRKVYAANELYRNNTVTAATRDKMIKEAQIMRQPGEYIMPLRICPKLPKQSAGQQLISTYNCRHYCLDSIVLDENPLRVICAEAMWRRHVMDKFSREWQDPKTGNLVGGYINERFYVFPDAGTPANPDVDRFHGNNMRLGPNERTRVARPHEYSIERRMQEQREKGSTKPYTLSPLNDSTQDLAEPKGLGKAAASGEITVDAKKKGKAVNPWAVCTESVGREDKEKYERCVMDVKAKHPIKKADVTAATKGDDEIYRVYSRAIDLHNRRVPAPGRVRHDPGHRGRHPGPGPQEDGSPPGGCLCHGTAHPG